MPGRFEGLNDLEWKLFQDIFSKNSEKRSQLRKRGIRPQFTNPKSIVGDQLKMILRAFVPRKMFLLVSKKI